MPAASDIKLDPAASAVYTMVLRLLDSSQSAASPTETIPLEFAVPVIKDLLLDAKVNRFVKEIYEKVAEKEK